jgi:hypothetical protein
MIRHSQPQPQLHNNIICATLPNENRMTGLPKREGTREREGERGREREREGERGREREREGERGRELTIKIPSKLPGRDQLVINIVVLIKPSAFLIITYCFICFLLYLICVN